MKRMIACSKCSLRPEPHYTGEWFKRVHGTAKKDMFCDWCSETYQTAEGPEISPTPIYKGDKCAAESMGVNGHGGPYYQWESEYIKIGG